MATKNPTLSTSSSSPYSSSSFSNEWTYDIFLNFRGEDVRSGFLGHLYNTLSGKGIKTFIDDKGIKKGEEITPTLINAIQESRTAIVIFSENYASSGFCLEELVEIMERIKHKGRMVWPVFYKVKPSHVRHQKGNYAKALAKHEGRIADEEKINKWRSALREAAGISGWRCTDEYEYKLIDEIIQVVYKFISRVPHSVGMDSRMQELLELLDVDGVQMVVIYGSEGMGKTKLASAVYNVIAYEFENHCFLRNVSENSKKDGLVSLQQTLLNELTGKKDIELGNVNNGKIIKRMLDRKKVLLILDDVNDLEQLKALTGGLDGFGSETKIMITTRNLDLNDQLCVFGNTKSYKVKPLTDKEARELISWCAFKGKEVNPIYWNILDRVIHHSKGIPHSLEKISSSLLGKTIWECNSILDMQKIPYVCGDDQYAIIKVALDADMYEHIGKDIYFDLVDHDKVRRFCIEKQSLFSHFKEKIYRKFKVPIMYQRFWLWGSRNHKSWLQRSLTPQEETKSVAELIEDFNVAYNGELKLFLELEISEDFQCIPPQMKSKEDLLLFFKLYDPSDEKIRYIGRFYVRASETPMNILTKLKELAGFAHDEEIILFEEIKSEPRIKCKRVDTNSTFRACQLDDGDIIWFQKASKVGSDKQLRYPDVPSFFEYVYNPQPKNEIEKKPDDRGAEKDDTLTPISPQPKKDIIGKTPPETNPNERKTNEKKPGGEKPEKSRVSLKIRLHCSGCISKHKEKILKFEGVESMDIVDEDDNLVMVNGMMDVDKLVSYLQEKMNRNVEVV